VFVDIPDTARTRQRMKAIKSSLKRRFRQLDIWMISYPINIAK
jgi:hypothetical protein